MSELISQGISPSEGTSDTEWVPAKTFLMGSEDFYPEEGPVRKGDLAEKIQEQPQQATRSGLRASVEGFLEQFRIIRRALVHPQVPWHAKAIATCAVLYIISPIQLIPNFIPVIGQMDDVVAVIVAMKYLKRHVPQTVLDECKGSSSMPHATAAAPPKPNFSLNQGSLG